MATTAFDSNRAKGPHRPPLSSHPAFPAIVALWFAALLGLGTLVLPTILLERLAVATGLASLVPAASPPLGFTARAVIALAAAVSGAVSGAAIARRVARAQQGEGEPRFVWTPGGSPRPLSVRDELGGEGVINGRGLPVTRRRALAIAEDEGPSDFLCAAPLPGEDAGAWEGVADAGAAPGAGEEDTLELCDPIVDEIESVAATQEPAADAVDDQSEDQTMTDRQEFRPFPAAAASEAVPDAAPSAADPLPFAAPSFSRGAGDDDAPAPRRPSPHVVPEWPAPGTAASDPADAEAATAGAEGPGLVHLLQRLGDSLERRRAWIAETRAAEPAAPLRSFPSEFEVAPAEEAARAMADYFAGAGASPIRPAPAAEADSRDEAVEGPDHDTSDPVAAAPRPSFSDPFAGLAEEDEGDDPLPDFSLPLRHKLTTPAQAQPWCDPLAAGEGDEDDGGEAASDCASLLAIGNPFAVKASEFVRIDEPDSEPEAIRPAVTFPGHEALQTPAETATARAEPEARQRLFDPPGKAPASPANAAAGAETDAALRAALATLQRMNGAA